MDSILIGRQSEILRLSDDYQRTAKDKYLPKIRDYVQAENLTTDDVIVRGMMLCNSARDFYYSRFSREALNEVVEMLPGRPVQASHTYGLGMLGLPLGRFFAARVTEHRLSASMPKRDSHWVEALFYLPNDEEGQRIARRIDLGVYKENSIGWRCMGATCSVCEDDIRFCGHVPGEIYERGGICDFTFDGVTAVIEGSLVYAGGQKNTTTFVPEGARSAPDVIDGLLWSDLKSLKRDETFRYEAARERAFWQDRTIEDILRSGRADVGVRSSLYALDLSRERFEGRSVAARWVREQDFRADRGEERDNAYRFAQFKAPEGDFAARSIKIDDGVQGIVLRKRDKRDAGDDVPLETLLSQS